MAEDVRDVIRKLWAEQVREYKARGVDVGGDLRGRAQREHAMPERPMMETELQVEIPGKQEPLMVIQFASAERESVLEGTIDWYHYAVRPESNVTLTSLKGKSVTLVHADKRVDGFEVCQASPRVMLIRSKLTRDEVSKLLGYPLP